ncbi:hypothetical protein DPMN_042188 [Dreissena polymorpha]|uniref:Uncharacterized protein n=1 Tax=Dreissena polymorpha TaxID=45954 RepID=A0A9D4HWV3_DREPO|nr:hypothetical protein DPMN_042188 [Dreissena polymorpha]
MQSGYLTSRTWLGIQVQTVVHSCLLYLKKGLVVSRVKRCCTAYYGIRTKNFRIPRQREFAWTIVLPKYLIYLYSDRDLPPSPMRGSQYN